MKLNRFLLIGVCGLALAACDKRPTVSDDYAAAGTGNGGVVAGGASDPSSIAYFQQTIGDRVLFLVDQATLTSEGIEILNRQAGWLNTNAHRSVLIEGHADEQGTREYNLALGARRASAVKNHLVSRGVAGTRVKTVTFGKERPLEVCSIEECWSKNRRALTVVAGGIGS